MANGRHSTDARLCLINGINQTLTGAIETAERKLADRTLVHDDLALVAWAASNVRALGHDSGTHTARAWPRPLAQAGRLSTMDGKPAVGITAFARNQPGRVAPRPRPRCARGP